MQVKGKTLWSDGFWGFVKHLVEVNEENITLKFLYDHMRNYLISGVIVYASFQLIFKAESFWGTPSISVVSGLFLFLIGFGLYVLNILQGQSAILVCIGYGKTKSKKRFFIALVIGVLMTLVMSDFFALKIFSSHVD